MPKKKSNEINGVKIITRYSVGTIITTFLTFVLIFIPLTQLLFMLFYVEVNTSIISSLDSTQTVISFSGLDVIWGFVGLLRVYFFNESDAGLNSFATYYSKIIEAVNSEFANYAVVILVGVFLLFLAAELIIAIVDVVLFIEMLFRGRLEDFKHPKNTAIAMFIMQLFFSCFGPVTLALSNRYLGFAFDGSKIIFSFVFFSISFVDFVAMVIIYVACFKGAVFVRNVNQFQEELDHSHRETPIPTYNQFPTYTNPQHTSYGPFVSPSYQPPQQVDYQNNVNRPNPQHRERKGLPADIKEIGDQAFNADLDLQVAIIPNTIKSIGASAFANCINLKVVSIPPSIQNIGYNAFFNCYNLKRINFNGTKEEWKRIQRGSNWLTKAGTTSVVCLDGVVIVNPHH